jgi:hypothetical protein
MPQFAALQRKDNKSVRYLVETILYSRGKISSK